MQVIRLAVIISAKTNVKGMTVKKTTIRYPLRVVRFSIDPESNPWGLALDGFAASGPRRLSDSEPSDETGKDN